MLIVLGVFTAALLFCSLFEGWLCRSLVRNCEARSIPNFGWLALGLGSLLTLPIDIFLWLTLGPLPALAVPCGLLIYFSVHELLHWNHACPRPDGKPRPIQRIPPAQAYLDWFETRQALRTLDDGKNFNTVIPLYDLLAGCYSSKPASIPAAFRYRRPRLSKDQPRPVRYHRGEEYGEAA